VEEFTLCLENDNAFRTWNILLVIDETNFFNIFC